jgi:hypothetical protein
LIDDVVDVDVEAAWHAVARRMNVEGLVSWAGALYCPMASDKIVVLGT